MGVTLRPHFRLANELLVGEKISEGDAGADEGGVKGDEDIENDSDDAENVADNKTGCNGTDRG